MKKINKKNLKWLIFLCLFTIILLGWGILLFWWAKYELIREPLLYVPIAIPIAILCFVPCVFFIKSIRKIIKQPKERIKFSKRSKIVAFPVILLFSFLTITAFLFATVPSAWLYYNYEEGPYLVWNDDPKTTMTIIWITKDPGDTKLEFGKDVDDMDTAHGWGFVKRHFIKLKDLTSDTKYYYKIPGFTSKVYSFKTAPDSIEPFNFVVLGDNRNSGSNTDSNYSLVIDAMKPYNYEFIINVGDICHDGADFESWHEFFGNMVKHAATHPYMVAIGNHEYGWDLFARNFKYFFPYKYAFPGGHYYSFDYSNAHFIIIDNFDNPLAGWHYISEVQLQWVKNELAANQDKWLFVAFHVPPYSTGDFNMDTLLISQLCPLFYEYKVDIVLTGHDHHYEAFWVNRTEDWGGTYYFISGGGGATLDSYIMDREENPWKHRWHNASIEPYQNDYVTLHDQIYGELTYQFMHFEVDDDDLHVQAIRDNGTLIHEFFIEK